MTSPRLLPEARGFWDVMACWFYLILIFISPTMVMWTYALWNVCIYWLLLFISLHVWDTWANHFWVIDQLSLDYFLVSMMGLECGFIFWWCHVVTCLTQPFWSPWSVWFWDILGFLLKNQWIWWFILKCILVFENQLILMIISDAFSFQ